MKNRINNYITKSKIKYVTYIKNDIELCNMINQTIQLDIPLKEKIYLIISDQTAPPKCSCGNNCKFISIIEGYTKYCSSSCPEKHHNRIQASKLFYSNPANKEKAKINLKKTMLEKYSVIHNSQIPSVKDKRKNTWLSKYGVNNPAKSSIVQQHKHQTNINKYGVPEVFNSDLIRNKIKKTNIDRYNFENPIHDKNIKNKISKTNIIKYGVDKPFKSNLIQNKIKETNLKKLSVEYPFQSPTILRKIREKYYLDHLCYLNQNHIENYSEWVDPNKFKEIVLRMGCFNSSKYFNVHPTTIYKKICQYDLGIINKIKSIFEKSLCSFLNEHNIEFVCNTRKIIPPKEIDIYIPDHNMAIEANGLFWHSDLHNKNYKYHYNKSIDCKKKGIQLFHIWDMEWNDSIKSKIWKNKILHTLKLNKNGGRGARHFKINVINKEYNNFITENHIQGNTPTKYKFGAFFDGKLYAVMGFNEKNNIYDMVRWCTYSNNPGLFSKMLAFAQKYLNIKQLITFADLRYSHGDVYLKNGFTQDLILPPSYFYSNGNKIWHKSNFMKNKIKEKFNINIENKTEKELMNELGFFRVYDAGKIRFSKTYLV